MDRPTRVFFLLIACATVAAIWPSAAAAHGVSARDADFVQSIDGLPPGPSPAP
jgi:hypothetical protein